MGRGTDRAGELLERITEGPWMVTPPGWRQPSQADFLIHSRGGHVARMFCATAQSPYVSSLGPARPRAEANADLLAHAPDLLALAIKQHESLRGEHLYVANQSPLHFEAVQRRDYTVADTCPQRLVLLQWEQMWKESE